ncbi:recombinase family protein, partial [Escherichia coli]|uniref:recombinase family protein n=1 Tax=Escherichia coli TaxID=562 RepID=UPI00358E2EDC
MGHRAAIYCRVSTADQSCERQEFDLRAFAGCAGYDVVGIFKETGSGTKLDRAERKKVLALAQSRQIDAILVTELSRWGRSTGTVAKLAMRQPFVLFKGLTFQKLCL